MKAPATRLSYGFVLFQRANLGPALFRETQNSLELFKPRTREVPYTASSLKRSSPGWAIQDIYEFPRNAPTHDVASTPRGVKGTRYKINGPKLWRQNCAADHISVDEEVPKQHLWRLTPPLCQIHLQGWIRSPSRSPPCLEMCRLLILYRI